MSNNDNTENTEKLPDRREALKIAVAGGVALFAPAVKFAAPLAGGTALSEFNANGLKTIYLMLQEGNAIGPGRQWETTPQGVECCKSMAESIMKDNASSSAIREVMKKIIGAPDDPKKFDAQSSVLGSQLHKAVPGLHDIVVREWKENMRWLNDKIAGRNDNRDKPDFSKERNDTKVKATSGEDPKNFSRQPLLSADSENVFRRIRRVISKGKTGEEPFTERLFQDGTSILPKR